LYDILAVSALAFLFFFGSRLLEEGATMAFPTRIGSHPIHPMLIPFPIGLWIFSFVCDLMSRLGPYGAFGLSITGWSEMALYTMAGGIVGALAAAVFGLGDFRSLTDPVTIKVAKAHLVLNVAVVTLYLINFAFRIGSAAPSLGAILLSTVGLLVLGVSGWLGGELVYVHGVAVKRSDGSSLPSNKGKTTAA
jgi:uncharacterized membrane protein